MTSRTRSIIHWSSLAVILASLMWMLRALPIGALMQPLNQWLQELGAWGPIVFALLYVVATVCFFPGSILTLGAGAGFGLLVGFVSVSIGSVAGAAAAFLIARYVARSTVEKLANSNPKFAAIDEAISAGGWKIVGLLRLSPAIPFNLQNYLYGLTNIGFWPYILVSWLAMIPGTLLYVYLGHVAGIALEGNQASGARWGLLAVGLLATIGVTVYVTYLARQKLQAIEINGAGHDSESRATMEDKQLGHDSESRATMEDKQLGHGSESRATRVQPTGHHVHSTSTLKTWGLVVTAALSVLIASYVQWQSDAISEWITGWFGTLHH